jgi:uncharacterized surface protein with fasciclin (FAS1) repeats
MRLKYYLLRCGFFLLTFNLQGQQITEVALSSRGFERFSEALKVSNLYKSLKNGGSFTVFAPSDEAFQQLDETLHPMHPLNPGQLRTLISYHIIAGEFTASRILRALCKGEGVAVFTTIQGEQLIATMEGVDIVLMDCFGNKSRIVRADANSDNLVLHEIDRVFLPVSPIP